MRTLLYTGFFGFFLALLFSLPSFLYAQVPGSLEGVEISLSPQYPQPRQTVRATVSSAIENVRASTVIWLINGKVQQQKEGVNSFTFTAGEVGTTQSIGVLVKTASGKALAKSLTIRPSQVTLLWEADTYTPPLYKGRALYSSGSFIRAEAIPNFIDKNGRRYLPSELLYKWSKNGKVLGSVSGINFSSLVTKGPKFLGNYILSVEVSTRNGTQIARSAALVETTEPVVALYIYDPLTGIQYNKAISPSQSLFGVSQLEIQAVPYFMDVTGVNDKVLDYSWYVNDTDVLSVENSPSLLSVQLSTKEDISTRIRVVVNHALRILQTARSDFNITFEGNAGNSLFGL